MTETNTIEVTSAYTITETLEPPTTKATVFVPITLETSAAVTEVITIPSERTATSTSGTIILTSTFTTETSVTGPPTTSAPQQVSQGAAATNHPMAYAVAGAMALLALA